MEPLALFFDRLHRTLFLDNLLTLSHRLNMEIDLQSLVRLLCTAGLIGEGAIGQPR
jgi:hypothetical protein